MLLARWRWRWCTATGVVTGGTLVRVKGVGFDPNVALVVRIGTRAQRCKIRCQNVVAINRPSLTRKQQAVIGPADDRKLCDQCQIGPGRDIVLADSQIRERLRQLDVKTETRRCNGAARLHLLQQLVSHHLSGTIGDKRDIEVCETRA